MQEVNLGFRSQMVKTSFFTHEEQLPLVLQLTNQELDFKKYISENKEFISTTLLKHGAILFRDFPLKSSSDFGNFAKLICPELYGEYGDLPLEDKESKIYKSTPYPSNKEILFHNESSHLNSWPSVQFFFCNIPAEKGGNTPVVNSRKIFQSLEPSLRKKFEQKKLLYIRNFVPNIDVSWQDFFKTTEKEEVEKYCRNSNIQFDWMDEGKLRTQQIRHAIQQHPQTEEFSFFNQIFLHHPYCLEEEIREALEYLLGEESLPRNVKYGDGTKIEDSVIQELKDLYEKEAVSFQWKKGDLLLVDNVLTAHMRETFSGSRKKIGRAHV